jgi:hypothetical protein
VEVIADLLVEVDDGVPAQDEVERTGSDPHAEQVARVEAQPACELGLRDPLVALLHEPALERLARRRAGVGEAEAARLRFGDDPLVDVGAANLDPRAGDRVRRDGRQRVRLGAVRASRAPRADLAGLRELGQHVLAQHVPLLGVTPQLGDVDGDPVQEGLELGAIPAQDLQVVRQLRDAAAGRERADPPLHLSALVLLEVDPAQRLDAAGELEEVVGHPDACGSHAPASSAIAPARSSSGRTASARPASAIARGIP